MKIIVARSKHDQWCTFCCTKIEKDRPSLHVVCTEEPDAPWHTSLELTEVICKDCLERVCEDWDKAKVYDPTEETWGNDD